MSAVPERDLTGLYIAGRRFRLEERRGGGAFGTVYRATEYACGSSLREVAVKLTRQNCLTPEEAEELLAEGWTLARIAAECTKSEARRHLVHVYGLGLCPELDNCGYLAMEYVRGARLLEHLRGFKSSLPITTARRYFRELCVALDACHALGILHRDLKPDNVLVDETGTIRVVDFGLARRMAPHARYAAGGAGALAYQAPEVVEGMALPQSDLYAVGLIFYEALTGGGPHLEVEWHRVRLLPAETRRLKEGLVFAPIRERGPEPEVDSAFFELIERCCRTDHRERPVSLTAALEELDAPRSTADPVRVSLASAGAHAPRAGWEGQARHFLERGDPAGGIAFLQGLGHRDEPRHSALLSVLHEKSADFERALAVGAEPAEAYWGEGGQSLHQELVTALARSARALGREHVAEYYEHKLGDGPR